MISKVYQSNSTSLNTETFCLGATTVKMPAGRGRSRRHNDFGAECTARRGITPINNKDNMCLPRALVVAIAHVDKDPEFRKVRRDIGKVQTQRAIRLVEEAGVVIRVEGCGVDELQQFQDHLTSYNIVVYRYGNKGRDTPVRPVIKLLHVLKMIRFCAEIVIEVFEDNHVLIITSGRGAHVVCEEVKRCKDCLKSMRNGRVHTCGEVFCKVCNAHKPSPHNCFMVVDHGKPAMDSTLIIFYDLESTQEGVLPDGTSLLHEPNLCVFNQCCYTCIGTDIKICPTCCVRNQVLKIEPVARFTEYVLNQRKIFKRVFVISHAGGLYDNQFILNHILINTDP
ncbi:hypothetical protein NQ318_015963 [Aromia moschata]|uniref:Uncharacterized protein n=1 Tax=Aromia moschata TaxID=1265417 RepID=A0AAV8X4W7_9CUCU|nr:hypothetical protein NQ318_015963 [Aromia moschata]